MFYFILFFSFEVLGFWEWSFICGPASKTCSETCWDCHHQAMVCLCFSSDLVLSTAAVSKSAGSSIYLRGVQIKHLVFLGGTSISWCSHFDHTFVREMRFRTSSTLFLIRAEINQSCERALWSGENGTCWMLKTFEKPHFSSRCLSRS